jgi:hypothetical protein
MTQIKAHGEAQITQAKVAAEMIKAKATAMQHSQGLQQNAETHQQKMTNMKEQSKLQSQAKKSPSGKPTK